MLSDTCPTHYAEKLHQQLQMTKFYMECVEKRKKSPKPQTYKLAIKMHHFSSKDSSDEVFQNSDSSWDSLNCGTQFIEHPGEV